MVRSDRPVGVKSRRDLDPLASEPFLAALVRSTDDAVIGKTCDGVVVFWNEGAERLYGYSAEEMVGRELSVLMPPDRPLELAGLLASVVSGEIVRGMRTERIRKDGSTVPVSITVSPVVGPRGEVLGASTISRDLSLHNRQVADLRDAHRRADETLSMLETLQATAPVGLGFVDATFRIVHLNEVLASFVHATAGELVGRPLGECVPEIWELVEPYLRGVLTTGEAVHNVALSSELAADPGHLHHWLASYYPVPLDGEVIGVGVVAIDVTDRRRDEEFRSIVMNNLAEGLFTIDAEGRLTSMNDAASRMLGWTEAELVGREMRHLLLSSDSGLEAVEEGNRRLLSVRGEGRHVQLDDHVYRCRNGSLLPVSISASPLFMGTSIEGAVVVFRDITEERSERLRVRRELDALTWVGRVREAIDEERLVLYSQPILPLRTGRPSEELLLRMVGRSGELIAPASFLGVAEKYGLITEIDRWVVSQAIRRAASGRHVSANLSAESVATLDLLGLIDAELRATGADPADLVFEITETSLMRDIERTHAFVRGIVDLGCSVALDDFGTGFGTFTHVKELDVAFLKIDIEFVRGLSLSPANQHVVKAIVNLAHGFGCETIAEGVEDTESLELLTALGVDYGQGFLLGRPAPMGDDASEPRVAHLVTR